VRVHLAGDVTDQYATWTVCKGSCEVFVYDVALDDTMKAPNPGDKHNYESSLTNDGDLYFGHSGNGCGRYVKIERWTIGDPPDPVVVASLPLHIELAYSISAFTKADLHTDVYFDRFDCRLRFNADEYVIHDAETARHVMRETRAHATAKHLFLGDARPPV
jgi:hypothetical protein